MSPSERERLLQLLIPSLVIVVGYVWFFVPEPQGKLDKAHEQLEQARTKVTIPLQGQRQSLARVEREVAALRREREALRHEARDAHAHAAEHTTVESELTRLLRRHGLQLEASQLPEGKQLPPSLRDSRHRCLTLGQAPTQPTGPRRARRPSPRVSQPQPQQKAPASKGLRAIRFRGPYLVTLAALEEIAARREAVCAVPVALDLEATPADGGPARWTLVVLPEEAPE